MIKKYRLSHPDGSVISDGTPVDGSYSSSNYLLLRPSYGSASTSSGTPVPVASPSSPVAGPSTSSGGGGVLLLDDVSPAGRSASANSSSQHQHLHQQHFQQDDIKRDLTDLCNENQQGTAEEDAAQQHKEAQYLSANCVLFMSYSGDVASVVDQHFSRALNQATGSSSNDGANGSASTSSSAYVSGDGSSKGVITKGI